MCALFFKLLNILCFSSFYLNFCYISSFIHHLKLKNLSFSIRNFHRSQYISFDRSPCFLLLGFFFLCRCFVSFLYILSCMEILLLLYVSQRNLNIRNNTFCFFFSNVYLVYLYGRCFTQKF